MCNFAPKVTMMNTLDQIQAPIQAELQTFREQFAHTLKSDNQLLQLALDHILKRTGKMVRPTMVLLSARMAGGVNQQVMDVALALELLHTASLVHDDVVDESDERRGQPSLNALMTNQIAVLVGDFILSKALHHAVLTGSTEIVSAVATLGQTLADGELHQLANMDSDILDEASYYGVVRKKTASLFATCAQLGVMAAGGTPEQTERMRQLGSLVGTCFQLKDDLMDFCGNKQLGKPAGNDMREGKITLPVISALKHSQDEEIGRLALKVRRLEATEEDIETLTRLVTEKGGVDYTLWAMKEFSVMADGLIDEQAEASVVKALHDFVLFMSERDF